ncbi:hypothetical protein BJ508DRAFT_328774 [Ascobolus immersus RN42]|uniref:Uncharacterized protein n=1 Tax=Ascobolus immersus RN42 TaxID=1160509 RepID=A0A3N4HYF4_ASCIM|nr:hypothetical protein BJ508DRAFT_328774 [Ascobolus immersus RN42]
MSPSQSTSTIKSTQTPIEKLNQQAKSARGRHEKETKLADRVSLPKKAKVSKAKKPASRALSLEERITGRSTEKPSKSSLAARVNGGRPVKVQDKKDFKNEYINLFYLLGKVTVAYLSGLALFLVFVSLAETAPLEARAAAEGRREDATFREPRPKQTKTTRHRRVSTNTNLNHSPRLLPPPYHPSYDFVASVIATPPAPEASLKGHSPARLTPLVRPAESLAHYGDRSESIITTSDKTEKPFEPTPLLLAAALIASNSYGSTKAIKLQATTIINQLPPTIRTLVIEQAQSAAKGQKKSALRQAVTLLSTQ